MRWFDEKEDIPSEKNGAIRLTRRFGVWKVEVGSFDQTSAYTNLMWRDALRQLPEYVSVKRVLLLGLGAGGVARILRKRSPSCRITAVEWDPAMVAIGRRLGWVGNDDTLEILEGDAAEIVPRIPGTFDLIIVDLFRGHRTASALDADAFLEALRDHLEPDGCLLLNAFRDRERFQAFARALPLHARWRFLFNELALYRPVGNGRAGDPLPRGFRHCQESRRYLMGGLRPNDPMFQAVGSDEHPGLRWHFGPLWFESHLGDAEPALEIGAPRRLVMWQPLTRRDVPPGWHRSRLQFNSRQNGVVEITKPESYWSLWSSHAQRHRKKFLARLPYDIREVGLEEFVAGYHATGKLGWIRNDFIGILKRRKEGHGEDCRLFGAVDRTTGKVMAGLAVVDLPDISQSVHLIAYNHPDAEETSVGHGLIDHWFRGSVERQIRFLNFALVWAPGDPKGWRGYSRFKRQFGPFLIRYPLPLVRIAR
jgi:SAM-dependent methyltransferase